MLIAALLANGNVLSVRLSPPILSGSQNAFLAREAGSQSEMDLTRIKGHLNLGLLTDSASSSGSYCLLVRSSAAFVAGSGKPVDDVFEYRGSAICSCLSLC
jgi:hypothetical protein